jgi:DNA-binding protein HU-beta
MKPLKAATKTAIMQHLAQAAEVSQKEVAVLLDALATYLKKELGAQGPGVVNLAGLLKIKRVSKPASPERQGRNPQTGEPMTIKAKPPRTLVRIRALKSLKEMV